MAFLEDARKTVETLLTETLGELKANDYVNRSVYQAGISVREAIFRRHVLKGKEQDLSIIDDVDLHRHPDILLIGNAGTGKSLTLRYAYYVAAKEFLQDNSRSLPLWLHLKEMGSGTDILAAVNRRNGGMFLKALKEAAFSTLLFLDALDEILVYNPMFIHDLENFLEDHVEYNCHAVVACRRSFYRPEWLKRPALSYQCYHTDYLDTEVYSKIILNHEDRQRFFQECQARHIDFLLDSPFDGFFLARRFVRGQGLPSSRIDGLRVRIEDQLSGHEDSRAQPPAPPLTRMKEIASNLACLEAFSGLSNWTEQQAIDALGTYEVFGTSSSDIEGLVQRPLFVREGNSYRFSHQLAQEYLVAEYLDQGHLPLRKQRQLLESTSGRIYTRFRGIAAFLAAMNDGFYDHLVESDPLVVYLSEPANRTQKEITLLLKRIIDESIDRSRPPWREVAPLGERLDDHLHKHRPQNIRDFLLPYLISGNEIAELWATACAKEWGGCRELNSELNAIAHRVESHEQARIYAILAIIRTKDKEAIRRLYDLLNDPKDDVKGHVLQAYWEQEKPEPADFLRYFVGGKRQPHFYCSLEAVAFEYCSSLNKNELEKAFQYVDAEFEALSDLRHYIIKGLLERAQVLDFDAIPVTLIVRIFESDDAGRILYREEAKSAVRNHPVLFKRLWEHLLTIFKVEGHDRYYFELGLLLGELADDIIFELLPSETEGLSSDQIELVEMALQSHFLKEPTQDRLTLFKEKAAPFAGNLRLPELPKEPVVPGIEHTSDELKAILDMELSSVAKYLRVMQAIARHLGQRYVGEINEEQAASVIGELPESLRQQIEEILRECVYAVEYKKKRTGPREFQITGREFEKAFKILLLRGENFDIDKICEVIRCYGFMSSNEDEQYITLLERVKEEDTIKWKTVVEGILDDDIFSLHSLIEYLIRIESGIYVGKALVRIVDPEIESIFLDALVRYIRKFKPDGYLNVLLSSYKILFAEKEARAVREPYGRFDFMKPLGGLLERNVDEAWLEFDRLISLNEVPVERPGSSGFLDFEIPRDPKRLETLSNWYVSVRKRHGDDFPASELLQFIMAKIQEIDGQAAVNEIRRMIGLDAFPKAKWLNYYIEQIEDKMLDQEIIKWTPGEALSFINDPRKAIVHTEKDLFEWVIEAISSLKEEVESRAEGVQAFWDCREPTDWSTRRPKTEPNIQGVLWPRVKDKLANLAIVSVEERIVGPNSADFWIGYPLPTGSLKVPVELKRAHWASPSKLLESMETQLLSKYMIPEKAPFGIFVVIWFKDGEAFFKPKRWPTPGELLAELKHKALDIRNHFSAAIEPIVIDVTKKPRTR